MNPQEYLNFKKDEFYAQLEVEGISHTTIDSVFNEVSDIISKLIGLRHSSLLTKKLLESFGRLQYEKIDDPLIKTAPRDKSFERIYIEELLIKAITQDNSYTYAYNLMAQGINKAEEQVFFPIKDITESEIFELLDSEITKNVEAVSDSKTKGVTSLYSTHNEKEFLDKLYNHCTEILNCTKQDFNNAVKTANFSDIEVNTIYKTQHLLFKLSKNYEDEWYTKAVKSKNWKKSDCSGQGRKLDTGSWSRQLDKIISKKM
jgi:hypothetical protein